MQTVSSYGVELRKQNIPIRQTLEIYRSAVCYLTEIYEQVWEELAEIPDAKRRFNAAEHLVHTTKKNPARFDFDLRFPKMPSYLRRAAIQHALGSVSSYETRMDLWEKSGEKAGKPRLAYENHAMPVFYRDVMYREEKEGKDEAYLKLYDGHDWKWFCVRLNHTDMEYLRKNWSGKKASAPTLEKGIGSCVGKETPPVFSAFFLYRRSNTDENTGKRTDHLQCGSGDQYRCSLYHHAGRRNCPGKKIHRSSQ